MIIKPNRKTCRREKRIHQRSALQGICQDHTEICHPTQATRRNGLQGNLVISDRAFSGQDARRTKAHKAGTDSHKYNTNLTLFPQVCQHYHGKIISSKYDLRINNHVQGDYYLACVAYIALILSSSFIVLYRLILLVFQTTRTRKFPPMTFRVV